MTRSDVPWAAELNRHAAPHVNVLSEAALWGLVETSTWVCIAELEGQPSAFLVAFDANDHYDSDNFLWFQRWHRDFLYIDRVVVDPTGRRCGVGRAIYAELVSVMRERYAALMCEVNVKPPNPGSLSFHQRCGFQSLCSRFNEIAQKRVLMMRKILV
jgi:predicted GNAT superfamily acetyltransferase